MTTTRWILHDPQTDETWTMPINPDSMSRDVQQRTLTHHKSVRIDGRVRTFVGAPPQRAWTWGGVIRSKVHYDELERWARKDHAIEVTDHLGLTFEVYIEEFDPTDRRPNPNVRWRLRYTMKTTILEGPL